jgi:ferredoxin/flavodoxin---NADP+ reductase
MLCGSPQMLRDMRAVLGEMGFQAGTSSEPGTLVVEKAFR